MGDEKKPLNLQLALRVSEDEARRLDALSARLPIATRHAIARAALRIGLDALEKDPARLLEAPLPKRGRR